MLTRSELDDRAAETALPTEMDVALAPLHYRIPKRALDIVLSAGLLGALSPLMLAAALAIRLTSPGPVLFRQVRIGQCGKPFTMFKFRTMYDGVNDAAHRDLNRRELRGELHRAPNQLFKLEQDPRITPVGHYLRAYSIDELPQFINVLRGEMSLVGPRPSLPWEVEMFSPAQRLRELCRPGVTGLWQVSGRNRLSMSQMLALDAAYVKAQSLRLDLLIILKTPAAVLARDTR